MARRTRSGHVVAVVQRPPVLLDRAATLERVVAAVDEAAAGGASLVSFPEAYVSGYPIWVWRVRPGNDYALSERLHAALAENAVDLTSTDLAAGHLAPVAAAARRRRVTVSLGVDERDGDFSRGTLYNTLVLIGPDGTLLNRHRKLMPTNPERMVWGLGDGAGLRVVDTPSGRVGGLVCWENYMPLARYTIFAQGVEVYLAPTWASGEGWLVTMRHVAQEGRCWVVGNGTSMQGRDVPASFPGRETVVTDEDEWINDGDSVVVSPQGEVVAGPLHREHGILYAECDPARPGSLRRTLDVAGHYNRPDVFRLEVVRESRPQVTFRES